MGSSLRVNVPDEPSATYGTHARARAAREAVNPTGEARTCGSGVLLLPDLESFAITISVRQRRTEIHIDTWDVRPQYLAPTTGGPGQGSSNVVPATHTSITQEQGARRGTVRGRAPVPSTAMPRHTPRGGAARVILATPAPRAPAAAATVAAPDAAAPTRRTPPATGAAVAVTYRPASSAPPYPVYEAVATVAFRPRHTHAPRAAPPPTPAHRAQAQQAQH